MLRDLELAQFGVPIKMARRRKMTDQNVVKVEAVPQQHLGQQSESAAMISMIERMAKDPTVDVEKMARILEMRYQLQQQQALTEFNNALAEAQAEMDPVRKDCQNPQTRSQYASFYALDEAVRPVYTSKGLTVSFDTDPANSKPGEIMVLAYVSLGAFTRTYRIPMPADGIGAKGGQVMSKTHATGSAITYGRRYLLSAIFNIATADSDDDGNAAGRRAPQAGPNVMTAPKPKQQPVVGTDEFKKLDRLLSEEAEAGSARLATAWKQLTPLQQHTMAQAKDRRYKPRAAEVDAMQKEQQHEADEAENGQDKIDDDIPF
jgi:hypothetical protein